MAEHEFDGVGEEEVAEDSGDADGDEEGNVEEEDDGGDGTKTCKLVWAIM